jgi:DNA-binding NarL/FixJ family response regulator
MNIRSIFIASKERMFVDCLITKLELAREFEVVGDSKSGATAFNDVKALRPDLVITDLNLEGPSGINLIRKIKASGLPAKLILLSADLSPSIIHKALSAGVDGIILKNDHYSLLVEAISVIHERRFLSPGVSDPLVFSYLNFDRDPDSMKTSPLSDREEQVARLIGEGVNSKQIAEMLFISEKTVSKHRVNILRKLNLKNTAQLTRYVYDNNLVG